MQKFYYAGRPVGQGVEGARIFLALITNDRARKLAVWRMTDEEIWASVEQEKQNLQSIMVPVGEPAEDD